MAFVSYHMGMGNLESVLRAYGTEPGDEDVSYTQVYFDSTPKRNAAAQRKLASFGDDSSNYLWKLGAAREIMRLHRKDAGELARLQAAQTAKNSAEEVLHPPGSTTRFTTPATLQQAWDDKDIVAFPDNPRVTGLRARRAHGRAGPEARALPRAAARGARDRALHRGADARLLGPRRR